MLSDILENHCIVKEPLSKAESIKIQQKWIGLYANKVKEETGKWRIGKNLWEGFAAGIQPSYLNVKAIEKYKEIKTGCFYVFDESGKHAFKCCSDQNPEIYDSGLDLYLVAEDFSWTVVFCHDNVVYFSEYNE